MVPDPVCGYDPGHGATDCDRLWFISCSALVNGGAGLALVLKSN